MAGRRQRNVAAPVPARSGLESARRASQALEQIDIEMRRDLLTFAVELEGNLNDSRLSSWIHQTGHGVGAEQQIYEASCRLVIAATYMQAGEHPAGRRLLQEAANAHAAFLREFEAAMARPRTRVAREFFAGMNLTDRDVRNFRLRQTQSLNTTFANALAQTDADALIAAALAGKQLPSYWIIGGRLAGDLRRVLADPAVSWRDTKRYLGEYTKRYGLQPGMAIDAMGEDDIDVARLLTHVPERLGVGNYLRRALGQRAWVHDFSPFEVRHGLAVMRAALGRSRQAGPDRLEIRGRAGKRQVIATADSKEQLRLRWGGLVRDAAFHAGRPDVDRHAAMIVTATCTRQVLEELIADGAHPIVLDRGDATPWSTVRNQEPVAVSVLEGADASTGRGWRRVFVGASYRTTIGGREVECRAVVPVATQARIGRGPIRHARASAQWPAGIDDETTVSGDTWDGAAVALASGEGPGPQRPAEELFGDGSCRHETATWAPDGVGRHWPASTAVNERFVDDSMVLSCGCCLRRRLASVPAHRLPEGHELLMRIRNKEEEYLAAQHTHELLAGGDVSAPLSIEQLRARDGIASLDIAPYAHAPAGAVAAAPKEPRRVRTIAEAMRRR